jgi:hypothetical protein
MMQNWYHFANQHQVLVPNEMQIVAHMCQFELPK